MEKYKSDIDYLFNLLKECDKYHKPRRIFSRFEKYTFLSIIVIFTIMVITAIFSFFCPTAKEYIVIAIRSEFIIMAIVAYISPIIMIKNDIYSLFKQIKYPFKDLADCIQNATPYYTDVFQNGLSQIENIKSIELWINKLEFYRKSLKFRFDLIFGSIFRKGGPFIFATFFSIWEIYHAKYPFINYLSIGIIFIYILSFLIFSMINRLNNVIYLSLQYLKYK